MALWELRKRWSAFSAAGPTPPSASMIVPIAGKAWFRTMTKYEIIIYWSEEAGAFVAELPELPGCAAHGPTQDRALRNAQNAICLWIDTAKEFGDPVPAPKGRRLLLA